MILSLLALALAADPPCLDQAVASLRVDPNGFRIYREADDRTAFGFWLDCDAPDYDVSSAVHETVHLLSGSVSTTRYSFYLVGGERLEVGISPSPVRASVFDLLRTDERDGYAETYLTGKSGAQGYLVLLDELNAYTHGLVTEAALAERRTEDGRSTGARDGVAHFLLYVGLYLENLEAKDPALFAKLAEDYGPLTGVLWKQAEGVLGPALSVKSLGIDDAWWLARAYDPDRLASVERFCGKRVWSSGIQKQVTRDPPARPRPPETREGKTGSRTSQQARYRSSVRIGNDQYEFEERFPSGEVILVVNGTRSPVKTWAEVETLGLPEAVLQALRESRAKRQP